MTGDLVSIVMPAYDSAAYIGQAIASVQAQSHAHWELVVVDDQSQDDTAAIVRDSAARDSRITLLQSPSNAGSAAARNLGVRRCAGRFLAFLDADDLWLPQKLERQLGFLRGCGAGLSFTAYRKFSAAGPGGIIAAPASITWAGLLKGNRIGCSTVLLDASAFATPILFPTGLGRQEDYALWLSLLRDGGTARGLDEPLTHYRVHESSKSARKLLSVAAQWRVYREFERLSPVRALWYLVHYAVRGLVKSLR
jgi:teichuronic acid biosynthesis glycosyltransferase TuaG